MGSARKVRYTVAYVVDGSYHTPGEWKVKQRGKPNAANLAKDVTHFEAVRE